MWSKPVIPLQDEWGASSPHVLIDFLHFIIPYHICYLKSSIYSFEYSYGGLSCMSRHMVLSDPWGNNDNDKQLFQSMPRAYFLGPWVRVFLKPSCVVSGNPITFLALSFLSPQLLSPLLYRESSQCSSSQNDGDSRIESSASKNTSHIWLSKSLLF